MKPESAKDYEQAFRLAVNYLEAEGFINNVKWRDYTFFEAHRGNGSKFVVSWGAIARVCASFMPGIWDVAAGQKGVRWSMGRNGVVGVIMEPGTFAGVRMSRARCTQAGFDISDDVYSMGDVAIQLLRNVFPGEQNPARYKRMQEDIMAGIEWGYHRCIPGWYEDCEMYDVKSCYYNLLSRLPSLRCWVAGPELIEMDMAQGERDGWRSILNAVHEDKPLRNTLHGVMTGGNNPKPFWYSRNGKVVEGSRKPYIGPFRIAGLLVVQAAYELTRKEALTSDAKYSTIDCVIVNGPRARVWDSYGLPVMLKGRGNAHVCHRGSYFIPGQVTENYLAGQMEHIPVEGGGEAVYSYVNQWL